MAALTDVLGFAIDADRRFVFSVREGSRLAAIVSSYFNAETQVTEEELGQPPMHLRFVEWSTLADCDHLTARYVIEQLHAATANDSAARLAVVAMDRITFALPAPDTPEASHAP